MKNITIRRTALVIVGAIAASCFTGCVVVPGRRHRRVVHPPRPVVVKPKPVIVKPRPGPVVVKPRPVKIVRPPMPAKPRVIVPKRPTGRHVWVPGKYEWKGNRWVWKKGQWKIIPKGKAKGHYKK